MTEMKPGAHGGHPPELEDLKEFLRRHGTPMATGVGLALIVVLVVFFFKGHRTSARDEALMLFASARALPDLERVTQAYPKTPVAPLALLKLARSHYDNGNYTLALQQYDALADNYADHAFAPAAALGRAHCLEGQGQLLEAVTAFNNFAAAHPAHFLTPQAIFGAGRCLEQLGRPDEARILYETFIAEHADSVWISRAEESLAKVKNQIKHGHEPLTAATAAPTMPAAADWIWPSPSTPAEPTGDLAP